MSLRELAEQSDLTASYISQVERKVSVPSIESLRKISKALNVPTFYFFLEEDNLSPVVRRHERRKLTLPKSNLTYELLTPNLSRKMEIILAELKPGRGEVQLVYHSNTEECILVLEGQLEVRIAGETYVLEAGDSVYFEGALLQKIAQRGDKTVRYLSVITPPIF
ncbi:MAG: helix-turn-helix transcriptional regulator [Chloroflexi bacterium]|nr:helix-turn-helix transcriptional regulator [Chloroflexota bacterium]